MAHNSALLFISFVNIRFLCVLCAILAGGCGLAMRSLAAGRGKSKSSPGSTHLTALLACAAAFFAAAVLACVAVLLFCCGCALAHCGCACLWGYLLMRFLPFSITMVLGASLLMRRPKRSYSWGSTGSSSSMSMMSMAVGM